MRTIIFILFLASTNLSRLLAYDDDNVNNETESPHELDIYRRDDENYGETIKLVNRRSNSKSKNKNKITKPQPSGGGGGGSGNTNLARKNEIDSFFSKLETASKKGEKQLEEFTVDKIRSLIGDGNHLIVFDCQNPSYMKNKKAQNLPKELAKQIKIKNNCSLEVDNLWHVGSDSSSLTTFNVKSKSLSKPQLPFKKLTMHFMNLNMCDDFMKFMKHPGYFLKIYKKPTVCLNGKKIWDE